MSDNFTITDETKGGSAFAELPFLQMKEEILGKDYELSLVFVGPEKSQTLNKQYRNKNEPTDILSFPLDKARGEIFIDIETAKKESAKFERDLPNFIQFLVIHGLVHLEGFEHGSKMESEEKKYRVKFNV